MAKEGDSSIILSGVSPDRAPDWPQAGSARSAFRHILQNQFRTDRKSLRGVAHVHTTDTYSEALRGIGGRTYPRSALPHRIWGIAFPHCTHSDCRIGFLAEFRWPGSKHVPGKLGARTHLQQLNLWLRAILRTTTVHLSTGFPQAKLPIWPDTLTRFQGAAAD